MELGVVGGKVDSDWWVDNVRDSAGQRCDDDNEARVITLAHNNIGTGTFSHDHIITKWKD
jgi:hypothetical protein